MFAFQGKRYSLKVCNWVYDGWQKDALKIRAAEPASPCAAQYRGISDKAWRAALASSPLPAAAPRSGRDHNSSRRLPPLCWLQRAVQRLPVLSYCTITADSHAKARDSRRISVWKKAVQTWRLLLPFCRDHFNPCCTSLFILQVIYSFETSLWPFYKALPWSCSALVLIALSVHLSSLFITSPLEKSRSKT